MTEATEVTKFEEGMVYPPNGDESRASANVRLVGENGADILLTVRAGATVEDVTGVLDVTAQSLKIAKEKYHLSPAPARNGKSAANGNAPVCPDGHGKMLASTKKQGEYYCPKVVGTHPQSGKKLYCTHKVTV